MMDKLRECPFCGKDGDIAEGQTFGFSRQYQPCCRNCGLTLDIYDTAEQAITAWNNRHEPPNEPLSLEELRQMDGEPVWTVTNGIEGSGRWEIMCGYDDMFKVFQLVYGHEFYEILADTYGKTWLAYRHRPKEDTTNDD